MRPLSTHERTLALFSQSVLAGLKQKRAIVAGIVRRATPLPAEACREAHELLDGLTRLADIYRLAIDGFLSLPSGMRARVIGKWLAGVHAAEIVVSRRQDALARALAAAMAEHEGPSG
jgi:hypothetical protein